MDFKSLLENKLTYVVLIVLAFLLGIVAGEYKAIKTLQREYTPGPYSPGLDPDRIPQNWQPQQPQSLPPLPPRPEVGQQPPQTQPQPQPQPPQTQPQPQSPRYFQRPFRSDYQGDWNSQWEEQRGN